MDWTPTWLEPTWQAEAIRWIDEQLERLGRRRIGPVEQPHVRPWSTVMAVPTSAGPAWFKAAGPGTAYEARLLRALAGWDTPMVLEPLAVEVEEGWLLLPDGGSRLRDHLHGTAGVDAWVRILPAYASLQRELAPRVAALIDLGVPDLRPAAMPALFARLIDGAATGLDDVGRKRLRGLLPEYGAWCATLEASGIAPSLQHDDLHDGNVFVAPGQAGDSAGGGPRIFDWGDAVVAHPFATLLATLRSIASRDATIGRTELLRLRDAYLEPWTAEHPRAALNETVGIALRVGAVGRAFAWERALSGVPPPAHGDYTGAVGEWLLELFDSTIIP